MQASLTRWDVGDRAPDFQLPDHRGEPLHFYEKMLGKPVVLFFFQGVKEPECKSELTALAALSPEIAALGADIFAISQDDVAANAACAATYGLSFPVLRDPQGKLSALFGIRGRAAGDGSPGDLIGTFVLDANQRVMKAIRGAPGTGSGAGSQAAQALAYLATGAPAREPVYVDTQAPVLILPKVLDDDDCGILIDLWKGSDVEEGQVSDAAGALLVNRDVKSRRDFFIPNRDPLQAKLGNVIGRRVRPEIHKAFNYDVTCFESFRVACYESSRGGYFRPHRDNVTKAQFYRRFAMTLNLNEGYAGGHLRFPEYGPQLYRPGPGGAVLFSCTLLHEVVDVTAGQRFVLLNFFYGEADERQRQEYLKQVKAG